MSPRAPESSVRLDRKSIQLSESAGIKKNEQGSRKSALERGISKTEAERWQSFLSALDDVHHLKVGLTHWGGSGKPNARSDRDRAADRNIRVKPEKWDQEQPADNIDRLRPVDRKDRGHSVGQKIRASFPEGGFICQDQYCKQLLGQIYVDIHAASTPGVIQATADLPHHITLEGTHFCTQNWVQSNLALLTRAVFKVLGMCKPSFLFSLEPC